MKFVIGDLVKVDTYWLLEFLCGKLPGASSVGPNVYKKPLLIVGSRIDQTISSSGAASNTTWYVMMCPQGELIVSLKEHMELFNEA